MALFGSNRRKFLRLPCSVEAEYSFTSGTRNVPFISAGRNISLGGVCLIAFEPLKREQILELKLTLPGLIRPIKAKGKVVWSAPMGIGGKKSTNAYDTGIEFVSISDEDKAVLDQFIASAIQE